MLADQRRASVLDLVRARGAVRVVDVSQALGVSEMTVRRDLETLDRQGLVRRVHGGATLPDESEGLVHRQGVDEPAFGYKQHLQIDAKRAIARMAASMVEPGMSIALSAGTTTFALAEQLAGHPDLTVVTNSTDAAMLLFDTLPDSSLVILTGGVRTISHALVGPIAETALGELTVDLVFHGFHGVDPRAGFTCPNLDEVRTAQRMISIGRRLVALTDHTKIGVTALAKVADLSAADVLVTDAGVTNEALQSLRQQVAQVEVAAYPT